MTTRNDLDELSELWRLGRIDIADAKVRSIIRRLLNPAVRAAANSGRIRVRSLTGVTSGGEGILIGDVTTYNHAYNIGWGWKEQVEPGAFDPLTNALPIFYLHHWDLGPIGTASLTDTGTGIRAKATMFMEHDLSSRVYQASAAGALTDWSISFITIGDDGIKSDTKSQVDHIVRGEILEASVVLRGANDQAKMVEVRSARD